jgi:hypothetical protein
MSMVNRSRTPALTDLNTPPQIEQGIAVSA